MRVWSIICAATSIAISFGLASASASANIDGDAAKDKDSIPIQAKNTTEASPIPSAASSPFIDEDTLKKASEKEQTYEYQAQVQKILQMLVHSMYRENEAAIRELLSNGSDALEKTRAASVLDPAVLEGKTKLCIDVHIDKAAKTLSFTDTGVGMTSAHMQKYLGTIAESDTARVFAALEQAKQDGSGLIGQFGVGFYSAFLLADKVVVISKHNDDAQHIWQSDAGAQFTIARDPRGNTLGRGTQVILHLKPALADDFLDQNTLEKLLRRYGQFFSFPIYLNREVKKTREVPDEDAVASEKKDSNEQKEDVEIEESKKPEEKPKTKKIEEIVIEPTLINPHKPLWLRDPSELADKDYEEFYTALTEDRTAPMLRTHFKAEGDVDFRAVLFVPKRAPFNARSLKEPINGISFYVRRVLVTNRLEDFLPPMLSFVKGVLSSDDLPLNISRDTLQGSRGMQVIKKKVISKVFDMFMDLAKDNEKYSEFYGVYATNLKMEMLEHETHRKKLAKLLRFESSTSSGKPVSFDEYISRKPDGAAKGIYFLAGSSATDIEAMPFLERLRSKNLEVLYMIDPLDEHLIQALGTYEGHSFENAAREGLKLDGDDETKQKANEVEYKPLADWLKKQLSEDVESVVISNRLTTSHWAVVASKMGWSPQMERVIMAQSSAKDDPMISFFSKMKKVLEINPDSILMKTWLDHVKEDKTDGSFENIVKAYFDATVIRAGYSLRDPAAFTRTMERLIEKSLDIKLPIIEPPERAKKSTNLRGGASVEDDLDFADLEKTIKAVGDKIDPAKKTDDKSDRAKSADTEPVLDTANEQANATAAKDGKIHDEL